MKIENYCFHFVPMFRIERKFFCKVVTKYSYWDRTLIMPITDSSDIPNITTYLDQPLSGLTSQVQILQHINRSILCLILSLVIRDQPQLTPGPPRSVPYLMEKCLNGKKE